MDNIPQDNGVGLTKTYAFLSDLISKRGIKTKGHTNIRAVELNGGRVIEPTAFEPDPNTFRGEYYYNAKTNTLYRKKVTVANRNYKYCVWVKVSD